MNCNICHRGISWPCVSWQANDGTISLVIWAPSSEFVSSSIPSWQFLTAHAQPFRGARDLAFCQKVPLDSLLVWASSGGSGETARMRRLAWTFAARIGDKYQIRLKRPIYNDDSKYSDRHVWTNRAPAHKPPIKYTLFSGPSASFGRINVWQTSLLAF